MNTKHALTLKGFATLLLGVTIMATSCKKEDNLTTSNEMSDSVLSATVKPEGIMATGTVSTTNLTTNSTFEETDALSKWNSEQAYSTSITRASGTAKSGSYAAKFTINKSDPLVAGSYRAELLNDILPKFAERWYGFSTYLPSTFTVDPVPESIFQWHNVPNFSSGEDWSLRTSEGGVRQTPLHVQTVNGRYVLVHSLSTIPSDYKSPVNVKKYDLGPYQTGVWTDWVLHMKFTYQNDGIIEVWKNGVKVMTINGQTYYNDETGPYLKFGLYKWGWSGTESNVTQRTIYFDDFKIGSASASYNEVAPGGTATTPVPAPEPTPTPTTTTPVVFAVNGGGNAYIASNGISYQADKNYSGGFSHSVSTSVANTADDALYQVGHYGTDFSYNIPLTSGTYDVTFNFVENYNSSGGTRQFDVLAEGTEIIPNLDIFKIAGKSTAFTVTKTVSSTDGTLNLNFRGDIGHAMVSSIHIVKKSTETATAPTPTNQVAFAVNGGGSTFVTSEGITYQADKNYSGGFSHSVSTPIANTSDDLLYQIGHYGTNFSYNIPLASGTYDVVLHFAENYNSSGGTRQFDVLAEGTEIIANLDIFRAAGKNTAYKLTKTVSTTDGTLNLNFRSDLGDAMVSAIHIIKK